MRPTRMLMLPTLLALLLSATSGAAFAADAPSAADIAAMRSFTLDETFLQHYMDASDDIARDPCRLGMIDLLKGGDSFTSIDQAAAHYDAQPGVHAMLASHDLTAREMVLGMMTLTSAAVQDMRKQHPQAMAEGSLPVSSANMAFYEAHKAQIHQHMQSVAREQLKANGGKLPACLAE